MDIPNIQKQRKHLAKLVLDMDSARTRCEGFFKCLYHILVHGLTVSFTFPIIRWQQSCKSSSHPSNLTPGGAKADALREEMEETANRMEICRVAHYTCHLFQLTVT